jgi:hypothetical protein
MAALILQQPALSCFLLVSAVRWVRYVIRKLADEYESLSARYSLLMNKAKVRALLVGFVPCTETC